MKRSRATATTVYTEPVRAICARGRNRGNRWGKIWWRYDSLSKGKVKIVRLKMIQKLSNMQRLETRRVKELLKPRSVLKRTHRVARFPEIFLN
jgi:hypothetical protein